MTSNLRTVGVDGGKLFDNLLDERLVSAKEAAKLLSLSLSMLYKMGEDGRLRKVQIGRAVRFKYSEIRKLLFS